MNTITNFWTFPEIKKIKNKFHTWLLAKATYWKASSCVQLYSWHLQRCKQSGWILFTASFENCKIENCKFKNCKFENCKQSGWILFTASIIPQGSRYRTARASLEKSMVLCIIVSCVEPVAETALYLPLDTYI